MKKHLIIQLDQKLVGKEDMVGMLDMLRQKMMFGFLL